MALSRRDFLKAVGSLAGSFALNASRLTFAGVLSNEVGDGGNKVLTDLGYFPEVSPESFFFDESKYSPLKRELDPSEWSHTNRHLPIKLAPEVINRPGERSAEALMRVVDYTGFYNPRYMAAPGERASMCNIAAWDWSRALRVHLPHWKGETEMSADMLFRWISHPNAGGVYGEGWQVVEALPAQMLANSGVPVFALAENPTAGRRGHVAMVYPKRLQPLLDLTRIEPDVATVKSGRGGRGNGVMSVGQSFRYLDPTFFVHKLDFALYPEE